MDHFERKYICSILEGLSPSCFRFIDNLFFIWAGNKDQLIKSTIPSTLNTSSTCLTQKFTSRTTNYTQRFLNINSEHPISLKNSIPYS